MENISETLRQTAEAIEHEEHMSAGCAKDLLKAAEYIDKGNFWRASKWLDGLDEFVSAEIIEFIKQKAEGPLLAAIERLGGNHVFVYECGYDDEEHGPQTSIGEVTLREGLVQIMEGRWYDEEDGLDKILTLKNFIERYHDTFDDACFFFGTKEKYEERIADKRRKKLEETAHIVAAKHGVTVNTLEFLSAVDEEIAGVEDAQDEWNNPEIRMEEWAACQYAGVGQEVYFDDLNFENGRYHSRLDDLCGILNWVSEQCPLLWAKHEESKLAKEEEERSA